jgi:hypothetical protein
MKTPIAAGTYATYLLRTLPVDLQEHVLAGMQGRFDAAGRCPIVVAMYLRPFEESRRLRTLSRKSWHANEVVFETIALANRGARVVVRNRHPDAGSFSSNNRTSVVLPAPEGAVTM